MDKPKKVSEVPSNSLKATSTSKVQKNSTLLASCRDCADISICNKAGEFLHMQQVFMESQNLSLKASSKKILWKHLLISGDQSAVIQLLRKQYKEMMTKLAEITEPTGVLEQLKTKSKTEKIEVPNDIRVSNLFIAHF